MNFTPTFRKKRARVLVVDDDPIFGMIVNKHLMHLKQQYSGMGMIFDYVISKNSYDGMGSFDESADIVVLDYGLDDPDDHDITGMDLLQEIKTENPAVKVLIVSGQKNLKIKNALLNNGAEEYIQKGTNTILQLINYLNKEFIGKQRLN